MKLFDAEKYAGRAVCVAVSGGVDSVCLLHAFRVQAAPLAIILTAVHIEHGIRGEESERDCAFVINLCREWGIPLRTVHCDVPVAAREGKMGLEEAAREARYAVFREIAKDGTLVATAHHRDDVAETVLFRLARGTSPAGMRAIGEGGGVIRPLLGVGRAEILAYAAGNGLSHVTDATNGDARFTRNYIRSEVLPAFEKIFGHASEHLASFAARCADDDAYLSALAEEKIMTIAGDKAVPVDLPAPLFLRACLQCMEAERDYTAANLREIEKLKTLQSGRRVCLPRGQIAVREYGNIVFYRPVPPPPPHPFTEADLAAEGALRADLDRFPMGAVVRVREEGDMFTPAGGKRKTLKKFFTDRKIPSRVGRRLLLVADGREVLAVFGVAISEQVKLTEKSKRIGCFG